MYSFGNDYSEGAHKKILEALIKTNYEQAPGYGLDPYSQKAEAAIQHAIGNKDAAIHFVTGGTQANRLCLSAFLRPHEAIISPDSGHINVHETGAIEASGHKIITVRGKDGKITPEEIKAVMKEHGDEHMVKPRLVFLTDATEIGTIYQKDELIQIHEVCKEYGLLLYLDGARLSNALITKENDITLHDLATYCDAFYIGGTKNGALFGEAIVIINETLKEDFRYLMKQNGALMAKGRMTGIQFLTLFEDDLYLKLASHANAMAQKIQDALIELNIPLFIKTPTNQIFPVLKNEVIEKLQEHFTFLSWGKMDAYHTTVRFVCSWATREEKVDELIALLKQLHQ